jgi:hypothetical protein
MSWVCEGVKVWRSVVCFQPRWWADACGVTDAQCVVVERSEEAIGLLLCADWQGSVGPTGWQQQRCPITIKHGWAPTNPAAATSWLNGVCQVLPGL